MRQQLLFLIVTTAIAVFVAEARPLRGPDVASVTYHNPNQRRNKGERTTRRRLQLEDYELFDMAERGGIFAARAPPCKGKKNTEGKATIIDAVNGSGSASGGSGGPKGSGGKSSLHSGGMTSISGKAPSGKAPEGKSSEGKALEGKSSGRRGLQDDVDCESDDDDDVPPASRPSPPVAAPFDTSPGVTPPTANAPPTPVARPVAPPVAAPIVSGLPGGSVTPPVAPPVARPGVAPIVSGLPGGSVTPPVAPPVAAPIVSGLPGNPFQPQPTPNPTPNPTPDPTPWPTDPPTPDPTPAPTPDPTPLPTDPPTPDPTPAPTNRPTISPKPTEKPTPVPTPEPTPFPTPEPTGSPSASPTDSPPSASPTDSPTRGPSSSPTDKPTTSSPTQTPSIVPTAGPTPSPSAAPTESIAPSMVVFGTIPVGPDGNPLPTSPPTPIPTIGPTPGPTPLAPIVSGLPGGGGGTSSPAGSSPTGGDPTSPTPDGGTPTTPTTDGGTPSEPTAPTTDGGTPTEPSAPTPDGGTPTEPTPEVSPTTSSSPVAPTSAPPTLSTGTTEPPATLPPGSGLFSECENGKPEDDSGSKEVEFSFQYAMFLTPNADSEAAAAAVEPVLHKQLALEFLNCQFRLRRQRRRRGLQEEAFNMINLNSLPVDDISTDACSPDVVGETSSDCRVVNAGFRSKLFVVSSDVGVISRIGDFMTTTMSSGRLNEADPNIEKLEFLGFPEGSVLLPPTPDGDPQDDRANVAGANAEVNSTSLNTGSIVGGTVAVVVAAVAALLLFFFVFKKRQRGQLEGDYVKNLEDDSLYSLDGGATKDSDVSPRKAAAVIVHVTGEEEESSDEGSSDFSAIKIEGTEVGFHDAKSCQSSTCQICQEEKLQNPTFVPIETMAEQTQRDLGYARERSVGDRSYQHEDTIDL